MGRQIVAQWREPWVRDDSPPVFGAPTGRHPAQLARAKVPPDKTALQSRIDGTYREIDRIVYDLYGLTEEEIRIVQSETRH